MLRGRRLIYIRKPLILSRQHAEQTTYKYSIRMSEEHWLYSWMVYNVKKDDFVGSGLNDLYHLYSALFTRWFGGNIFQQAIQFVVQKLIELPESTNAKERAKMLNATINDGKFETYLPTEQEVITKFDFNLRGVNLGDNVKFIPFNQFASVKPAKKVRLLTRDSLMQVLIDTPIKKKIFSDWLRSQGGQWS